MRPDGAQEWESLLGNTAEDSPYREEPWGNECLPAHNSSLRVVGWNPSGLPHDNQGDKNRSLRQYLNVNNPDVVAGTKQIWHGIFCHTSKDWNNGSRIGQKTHAPSLLGTKSIRPSSLLDNGAEQQLWSVTMRLAR